jgi:hypothetical protein
MWPMGLEVLSLLFMNRTNHKADRTDGQDGQDTIVFEFSKLQKFKTIGSTKTNKLIYGHLIFQL